MSRTDIGMSHKINLFAQYGFMSLKRKFFKTNPINFLGYKVYSRSYDNLQGILREIFMFADYGLKIANPAPVIIDCGANIGISLLYFKYRFPKSNILAFEPSKENFKVLKQNVESNKLQDITLINSAVGKEKGHIKFWDNASKPGGSTSTQEVFEAKNMTNFKEAEVESVKLSDYIKSDIDLLKIDIEGAEGEVIEELKVAGKLKNIKEIIFEYHYNSANVQNSLSKILATLEDGKFKIVIFGTDFAISSEKLKAMKSYHCMIRAYKN